MTDKYIDLRGKIAEGAPGVGFMAIRKVLEWLDEHPDQVPGRTITASEFDEAVESCVTEDATVPPHTFAARLGVVCVPDPEPTNAEQIAEIIGKVGSFPSWERRLLAEGLDKAGVRAPEGGR